MVVTGLDRDQPTVSITNGREAKLKTLIRRYARRITIEQRFAEIIRAFCADVLSSTVNLKVDLDIVLAVLAQALLAALLHRRNLESDQPRRRRLACMLRSPRPNASSTWVTYGADNIGRMRSVPEFFIIALIVTLTPGPGTATIVRVAARDGRRAAMSAVLGNSAGVLTWGMLSAIGVSSLILASQIAYDTLRITGAGVLVFIGLRALLHRRRDEDGSDASVAPRRRAGWRSGLITSLSNPKLAVFFVALFPQFLTRGAPVLPYALGMAAIVVALDIAWFSSLTFAVDRARTLLKPRLHSGMERFTGAVMIGLGVRLAAESR